MVTVTNSTYVDEIERAETPVLMTCWAPSCKACLALKPTMEEIAKDRDIKIASLNVMESPLLAQRFGIMSLPTTLIMKKGSVIDRMVGAYSKAFIERKLGLVLARGRREP